MNTKAVKLAGKETEIKSGLTKVSDLYEELGVDPTQKWLYLDRSNDLDIPLLPDDHIALHGGETIVTGDINSDIGENPAGRTPVHITFNGKKMEEGFDKAKITSDDLCKQDKELEATRLFLDMKGEVDIYVNSGLILVLQDADSYFTIPSSEDGSIDVEECSKTGHKTPRGQKTYKIRIDGEKYLVSQHEMTGSEILGLVSKDYSAWSLNQKLHGGRRKSIDAEETVDFAQPGIERFETVRKQAQQG